MIVPFNTLPGTAKVWVYQSSKELLSDDVRIITDELSGFISSWTAHQADLKAAFEIFHNRFIVIGVDENHNDASGCSIDKKVNFIKELGEKIQSDFFNRLQVAYMDEGKIKVEDMHSVIGRIANGKISQDTIIFSNLVSTMEQFRSEWKIPADRSWLHQLIVK